MPILKVYARGRERIFINTNAYVAPDRKIASARRKIKRLLERQIPAPCPSIQEIEIFASGSNMPADAEDALINHLENCSKCDHVYTQALEEIFC